MNFALWFRSIVYVHLYLVLRQVDMSVSYLTVLIVGNM